MPTVEKVSGGRVYVRGIGRFQIGDRQEVSPDEADYLVNERGDFAIVDEPDTDSEQSAEFTEDDSASEADAAADDDEDGDGSEVGSEDEATDGFDIDAWLDQEYTDRADRVRAGDVDDHLAVIDEEETSDTVRDAIGERRAELEAETGG